MSELVRVINSVEQKTAEHWNLASKVFAECPKDLLERFEMGEDCYIATPAVKPADASGRLASSGYNKVPHFEDLTDAEKALFTNSFRLARHETHRGHKPGSIILIVNDNFRDPTLNFDDRIGLMTIMDADMVSDTEKFIPTILSELSLGIDRAVNVAANEKRHKALVRMGKFVGLTALAAASYFGFRVYDHVRYADDRAEAAADAKRADFDEKNVSINAPALEQSTISYVLSDPDFFAANQDLPKPDRDDTFESPRRLVIGSSDCERLATIVDPTDQIRIVTDAPAEVINVDVKADGQVRICNSTASTTDSRGNYVSTLDANIAVEITKG